MIKRSGESVEFTVLRQPEKEEPTFDVVVEETEPGYY